MVNWLLSLLLSAGIKSMTSCLVYGILEIEPKVSFILGKNSISWALALDSMFFLCLWQRFRVYKSGIRSLFCLTHQCFIIYSKTIFLWTLIMGGASFKLWNVLKRGRKVFGNYNCIRGRLREATYWKEYLFWLTVEEVLHPSWQERHGDIHGGGCTLRRLLKTEGIRSGLSITFKGLPVQSYFFQTGLIFWRLHSFQNNYKLESKHLSFWEILQLQIAIMTIRLFRIQQKSRKEVLNLNTQETKADGALWVQGLPGLYKKS